MKGLRRKAKLYDPQTFLGVIDEELFNPKIFKRLQAQAKRYCRFFVTTAVAGCQVHKRFLKSVDTFCKKNDALLLVLMSADPASKNGWSIDPLLQNRHIVFDDLSLNSNIFISTIKLSAKQIDPIKSLERIGQRNGSFIYASPKQRLKCTPTSNTKMPHVLMTTGAVTKPNYMTDRYMSERTAYIAQHDHVLGGVIVEIVDNKFYHFRQVQAERSGSFVDLGTYYQGASTGRLDAEAFVIGDYHAGETDPSAEKAWLEVIAAAKPSKVVFHDLFNGKSISHHEVNKKVLRAIRARENQTSLDSEIKAVVEVLNTYSPRAKELIVVKSNHDEFLDRYIEEGRYVEDPQNFHTALKLADVMMEGRDPLRVAVERSGLKDPKKVKWLSRDEDYKVARIELGAHGDKGANGAKGSVQAMENAYGYSVSGHAHTPEILRGAWQVGTSSFLKLEYNVGPSSWMHTSCLVYPNGARQLINSIQGKWRLE